MNIKKDSKSFFAYARSKSKSKFTPCSIKDIYTGKSIYSIPAIAEEFNKYFVSVFNVEDKHNLPQPSDNISRKSLNKLSDFSFIEEDVKKSE